MGGLSPSVQLPDSRGRFAICASKNVMLTIGGTACADTAADDPSIRVSVDNPRTRIQQFEIVDDGRITWIAFVS
jgi:hypothetical protein